MDKKEFINSVKEGAIRGLSEYRILPSLTIAQAILESAWGSTQLSQRANNLFGVKAFSDWTGKRITLPTTEWYNNKKHIITAEFRVYDSFNESIEDHSRLLSYSRYKAVSQSTDYKKACHMVFECGYATDPNYPEKLIAIIEENMLYDFDIENRGSLDNKIIKFQKLCNELNIKDSTNQALTEDNISGWRTESCLAKMPVIKSGSTGKAVKFIQEIVGADPADGIFGSITRDKVIQYQKNKNIEADGIVGIKTWTAIITN